MKYSTKLLPKWRTVQKNYQNDVQYWITTQLTYSTELLAKGRTTVLNYYTNDVKYSITTQLTYRTELLPKRPTIMNYNPTNIQ